MRRRRAPRSLALATLAPALLLPGAAAAAHDEHDPTGGPKLEDVPRLTVRGDAEIDKPADELLMNIGVVTEARLPSQAMRDNTARMTDVIKAVMKAGLAEEEYETGRFQIRPKYARRPRQPDADWAPQIVGYEVVNRIVVRTGRLDIAGELIEVANEAGANTVEVSGFGLAEPRRYRAEAIAKATRNAIADARALAGAADLRLVRIIRISLDQTDVPVVPVAMEMRAMADAGVGAPPIKAGDVTVRASVTLVYEIAPQEE